MAGKLNFTMKDCMRRLTHAHRKPGFHHTGRARRRALREARPLLRWLATMAQPRTVPDAAS